MSELTLKMVEDVIINSDSKLRKGDNTFKAAVVLVSAINGISNDLIALSNFTGYDIEFLQFLDKNLRENGVWVGNKTIANWDDEETGDVEFWLDVAVALGKIKRTKK